MEGSAASRLAEGARTRALAALIALGVGFVLARAGQEEWGIRVPAAAWFGVALLLGAACVPARGRALSALLLGMVVALGGGWFTLRILEHPTGRLALPEEPSEIVISVEGTVIEAARTPVPRGALASFAFGGEGQRCVLAVERTMKGDGWRAASGRLLVHGDASFDAPLGRRVRVTGRARSAGPPTNPGQADARLWAAQDGVVGTMYVPDGALIESATSSPSLFQPLLDAVRQARTWLGARAASGLESIHDPRARALVASLLLGAEEEEGRAITTTFQRIGLAHVLAISGVHIAVLAWATLLGIRLLGDFGAFEPALAAAAVILYLLVVPAEAPVVRSGVMVLALLAGDALGRRYDGVVILTWTAVLLLLIRPLDLWSLGFQLSFGVTGVLLGGGQAFHARIAGKPTPLRETTLDQPWWRRLRESTTQAATASVLAWAVATPWIAARVGLFAPLAPISSLIVGVPVSVLMVAGFVAMLVGTLIPGGGVVWGLLEPVANVTLACVDRLDGLPGSSIATGSVPLSWGGVASVGVLWLLTAARWRPQPSVVGVRRARPGMAEGDPPPERVERAASAGTAAASERTTSTQSDRADDHAAIGSLLRLHGHWTTWSVALGLALWLLIALTLGRSLDRGVALRLDTLDVGDATCHLIRSGDEAWLWDCGSSWAGAGEVRLPGAIRALRTPPVTGAIITHANFDHFNCLPDVSWRVGLRRVLVSAALYEEARDHPRSAAAAMLDLLRGQGVQITQVSAGETMRIGEATLTFLWPDAAESVHWEANDQSLVARITVPTDAGPRAILLCGDIQNRAIDRLLRDDRTGPDAAVRADVLEMPHHGANSRAAEAFVRAVGPSVVVQSTGRTRIGLARAESPRWRELLIGITWLCTARDGATRVEIRRDGSIRTGSVLLGRARPD